MLRRLLKILKSALLMFLLIDEHTQLNVNRFHDRTDTQLICAFLVPTDLLCQELFFWGKNKINH